MRNWSSLKLDTTVANQVVDADASGHLFSPFDGARDLVDRRVCVGGLFGQADPEFISARLTEISGLIGKSRSHIKAGLAIFGLLQSIAALGIETPEAAISLLASALDVEVAARGRRKYQATEKDSHYADGWFSIEPHGAEIVALKVLTLLKNQPVGRVPRAARLAIVDIFDWHRFHLRITPAVVTNALAAVVGLIDPDTAKPHVERVGYLLGIRQLVRFKDDTFLDATNLAMTGRRLTVQAHQDHFDLYYEKPEVARTVRGWRGSEAYRRLEANALKQLVASQDAREGLARIGPPIWARWQTNQPGKRLANWRSTYWRMLGAKRDE